MLFYTEKASDISQLAFYNSGNLVSRDGFLHQRRTMECFVLIYILTGGLSICSDERQHFAAAGEWLLLKPNAEHFGTAPSCGELSYLWAHFSMPFCCAQTLPDNYTLAAQDAANFVLPEHFTAAAPRVGLLFRHLVDISRRSVYSPRMALCALESLLMEITQEYLDSTHSPARSAQNIPPLVADINEWLRLNCHRRLNVAQIAAHFHYNPDYLSALYKKLSGVTLTHAANQARVDIAKRLLSDRAVSIKETAFSCGFDDEKYFMRVFREFEGISPSEYRAAIGVK